MQNPKTGGNRFNLDIRPSKIDTYTETSGEQTAEYKIINAHPIINGILNKLAFFRTHAAAVYYNRLANKTVKQKFDDVDAAVGELNEKLINNLGKIPELSIDFDDAPLLNILTANNQSINKPPRLSSNAFLLFQLLPHNKNYSAQVAFGFGNREIAMRTRANGNSTAWSDWDYFVPKSYVDDKIKIIDSGNFAFDSTEANGNSQKVISFRKAFNTIPNVVICPSSTANPKGREMATIDVTKTGFTATLHNASGEVISPYATWIAIGS